jgi:hypothetical protein
MSLQASQAGSHAAIPIERKSFPGGARSCTAFALVAKALWPRKTAIELSIRTGASERTAKYWLAGRYEPSAAAAAAIVAELFGHRR